MVGSYFSAEDKSEKVDQNFSVYYNQDIDSSLIEETQKDRAAIYSSFESQPGYVIKYLVYSSKGFQDAYDKCDVIAEKLGSTKDFFTKIPTDKLCTTNFTVTIGDTKYVVKVQKFTVDTSKLIHKNIKDTVTPEEEAKDIKNIQSLYTYFGNVFMDKIHKNNPDPKIKEIYNKLMAEVADDHQGYQSSGFMVDEDIDKKYCTIDSANTTHDHNIYAPYSKQNEDRTFSPRRPSVILCSSSLFDKRDKVSDNKVRSSVLSLPKYIYFKATDINEADKTAIKRDKIIYYLEQTFVENVGTLTEEQKKENEINYNEAVKIIEENLRYIDTIMKDLAALSRYSTDFSKKVREFTKQKLLILTKELNDTGLKIHICDNHNKKPIPVSNIPTDQIPLKDAINKGIDHENFVNGIIKKEIINHIKNSTKNKLDNEDKQQLNIKMPDLYKKTIVLSKQDLNQYLQGSPEHEDDLLVTKEISIKNSNEKALIHFYFQNNLPKKSVDKCCNANGVQYGLEYKREITRLIEHVLEEIKVINPFNFKFDNKKTEDLKKEKQREKLLEKYLFSSESNSAPKIEINDERSERSRKVNEGACILYNKCIVTLPKEKDTDQIRPIKFEVIIENPNYKDKSS